MITFTKVRNEWMLRLPISPVPFRSGQEVTVTKRNGGTSTATLGMFVMSTGDAQIWSIAQAPRATENVGDLSGIIALFDTARAHLRFPAITLDGFRVNVAGQRAREPGSLTVTGIERTHASRFGRGMVRQYFGRVTRAGVYEPSRGAPDGIGQHLRAFAADPAGQAAEHGRLHGACCFCNRPLRDERSTAVGYGPDCAEHFGLPWGARTVAAPSVSPAAPRNVARSIASEEALDRAG